MNYGGQVAHVENDLNVDCANLEALNVKNQVMLSPWYVQQAFACPSH